MFGSHQGFSKALDTVGITATLIAAGRHEIEQNPLAPLGDVARKHMQSRVNDYYDLFTRGVAHNRGVEVAKVRNQMGQSRLLDAERARRENMVDGVATFDEVVGKRSQRVGRPSSGPARGMIALRAANGQRMINLRCL